VIPGIVNGYWLGLQRRDLMLWLALGSAILAIGAAIIAPEPYVLACLALSQAVPAAVLLSFISNKGDTPGFRRHSHPLRRYVLPGLSIGILGPLSLLVARATIGEALSWHDAGVMQALWRLSDWVAAFAAGILSALYLPRFAAHRAAPRLMSELKQAALATLLPSAVVFAALFYLHQPLLAALYDPGFKASDLAAALFFAGSLLRVASWIPLYALYANRSTAAITIGELLSLPLFAVLLLAARAGLTLELAGAFWAFSYAAYCGFNFWALRRALRSV
jgi:O-antigen/teichoic acid export membrane protein